MIDSTQREPAAGSHKPTHEPHEDFSLVLGGPLYQLFVRARLARPTMELLHRRIFVAVIILWVPLAVLTAVAGRGAEQAGIPFVYDLDVHVKFLITVPLLIGAELMVHRRLRSLVEQFLERGLIAAEDHGRFEGIIERAMRLRNSVVFEILLIVLVFTGGYWLWQQHAILRVATWYAVPADGDVRFTHAGYWYAFVSLPLARFILVRWYFRILIWYQFLWRVARLRLRLNPLHPDRAGGLAFLSGSVDVLAPVLIAQSALLAGLIANQIWHANAKLPNFKLEILGFAGLLLLIVLLPLTFFAFQLNVARRQGLREFGLLAARYVNEFRMKWVQGTSRGGEGLLGSGDIQSLADLGNSHDVVREMRMLPFGKDAVIRLAVLIAAPLLPLTLTMVPVEEIVDRLLKMVL